MAPSWVNLLAQVIIRRGLATVTPFRNHHRPNRNLLNLMTTEDDTIAIAIIKPQDGIDERACVAAVRFCVIED
jgi:hypothetical protein